MNVAAASGAATGYLNSVSAANVDAVVDISYDKAATGGGFYTSLLTRRVGTSDYRVKVRVMPTGTQVFLARTVGRRRDPAGGGGHRARHLHRRQRRSRSAAGGRHRDRRRSGPRRGTRRSNEPAAWTLTTTDTTASLQNPGAVGIYTYVSGSATNAPVKTYIDNLLVGAPVSTPAPVIPGSGRARWSASPYSGCPRVATTTTRRRSAVHRRARRRRRRRPPAWHLAEAARRDQRGDRFVVTDRVDRPELAADHR